MPFQRKAIKFSANTALLQPITWIISCSWVWYMLPIWIFDVFSDTCVFLGYFPPFAFPGIVWLFRCGRENALIEHFIKKCKFDNLSSFTGYTYISLSFEKEWKYRSSKTVNEKCAYYKGNLFAETILWQRSSNIWSNRYNNSIDICHHLNLT